jgi:hypothetical protein
MPTDVCPGILTDSTGSISCMTEPAATPKSAQDVLALLHAWGNEDEPLVEAVGNTIAAFHRVDSQELARRVVSTVIEVLERYVPASED